MSKPLSDGPNSTSTVATQMRVPDVTPSASHLETFRLPKPGERDPHFGLARSFWYQAEAEGRLKLIRIKSHGKTRGIVLIPYEEARHFIFGTTTPEA